MGKLQAIASVSRTRLFIFSSVNFSASITIDFRAVSFTLPLGSTCNRVHNEYGNVYQLTGERSRAIFSSLSLLHNLRSQPFIIEMKIIS